MNTQKNQPLLSWFSVKGRARRKEVWIKWIVYHALWQVVLICSFGDAYFTGFFAGFYEGFNAYPNGSFFFFLLLWLPISVDYLLTEIRRLHDLGLPGWIAIFFSVTGLSGDVASFIFCCFIPGTKGDNKYGPNPRLSKSNPVDNTSSKNRGNSQSESTITYNLNSDGEIERKLNELSLLKAEGLITEEAYKELRKKTILKL